MSEPLFVRLPVGVGIEPDPSSTAECPVYRLVGSIVDVLSIHTQALIALYGGALHHQAADMPLDMPAQVTAADEVPAGITDPVPADPPSEWPYRVWAAWCAANGVPQLQAIHAMRRVALTRGEIPPGGLRAIQGRPEYAAAVMDLASGTAGVRS